MSNQKTTATNETQIYLFVAEKVQRNQPQKKSTKLTIDFAVTTLGRIEHSATLSWRRGKKKKKQIFRSLFMRMSQIKSKPTSSFADG